MSTYNTPYDDVFRTLLSDCKELIIPVINEIFNEQYEQQSIELLQNEIYVRQQNGEESKKVTDSLFVLTSNSGIQKKYHLECQSIADGSMVVRMFEYDSQIALLNKEIDGNVLRVNFPDSAVLYLRHTKNTPDMYYVEINTPNGSIRYQVPTLKVKEYTIDEIFEKQLFFLIPFYIFGFEAKFSEISKDMDKLRRLQQEFVTITTRLDNATKAGIIDEYTNKTICEMTRKVVENIAAKHVNIIEEVSEVMGGKILDYEAKDILNRGRDEGALNMLISLVKKGLLAIDEAAKEAHLSVDEFMKQLDKA